MSDPRLTPANGRVAAARLRGWVEAQSYVEGERRRVDRPIADLLAAPAGRRERQLLLGEEALVYEDRDGWSFVEAVRDGYVGYLQSDALGEAVQATHTVASPATHLYPAPELKAPEVCGLSFGARLRVVSAAGAFYETHDGRFVPRPHLRPANRPFADPATVAQMHFGTPYLWGGNSIWGLDCSGLVQAALLACDIPCPGDSDLQAAVGREIPPAEPLRRGDLLFWKGHVAMAVDPGTLIHANALAMAVSYEPVEEALARILASDGPVTARRRVTG